MEWIIKALILLLVILFLASPWLGRKKRKPEGFLKHHETLADERVLYLQQLADLEYDFQMDKISEEDYQEVKEELEEKLKEIYMQEEKNEEKARAMVEQWLREAEESK
ncbi:c-type cytochrome biogenesis protein CcmI [Microaerobacter geothermalis]|nr:c-type cytochrome biogenesis protein CcmI [Microaerobacter geothermalis]